MSNEKSICFVISCSYDRSYGSSYLRSKQP